MSASFSVDSRLGRVIEARVFSLRTLEEADEYASALGVRVSKVPLGVTPVLCADHRPVSVYSQPVADRLVQLFTAMNGRLERVAILASPSNATLTLQLERIVRTAGFAARRLFFLPDDALKHFAPALDQTELERVRVFLAEHQG